MIETLTSKLLEIFETMTGVTDDTPFTEIFDYITFWTWSYPFLCFEIEELKSEILDNWNNLRTYIFNCFILQEINEVWWRSEAKSVLTKAMDLVINTLDANYTLDWLCEAGTEPIYWVIEPMTIGNWSALVAQLKIACKTIHDIRN